MSIAERLQGKGPRRSGGKQVRLRLVWIDFWSALKLSAIVGVIAGIVLLVATFVLWSLLNVLGLFGRIDETLADILGDSSFTVMSFVSLPQVLLFTVVVALLNFVVITVLGAVFATLYNLSVRFTGGLLVGFANQ
ncbi:hypothetical protein GCM10009846_30320 [Agrococcus versicolor]|uniref:DUF3566 domain-containing protein n=1 Tax=Agrococcus versicolor TaxID=501482 RepID=A0ABN3AYR5_9MICO